MSIISLEDSFNNSKNKDSEMDISNLGLSLNYFSGRRLISYNYGFRIVPIENHISQLMGFPKSMRLVTEINELVDELETQIVPKKNRRKYSLIYLSKDVGSTVLADKGFFKDKIIVSMAKNNEIHEYQFIRKSSQDIKYFIHNSYTYEGTVLELFDGLRTPILKNHECFVQTTYNS